MELSGILEIVLIVLVLGLFGFIALSGKGNAPDIEKKLEQDQLQRQNETERLERKVADLNKTIYEMQNNLNKGVLDMQNKMTRQLLENNEKTNFSFQKQFSESRQIMKESNKTITDITNRLAKFEETNKNVLSATDKLENLQNILLNPKQRGTFGEFQL
ncbi:MAG: DNA recombination protein RmuC, partial [Bifidobacteriaceae bacterium]|nr:DNA recombination protein RmuC [Bifidobacteriaceae bacterium]